VSVYASALRPVCGRRRPAPGEESAGMRFRALVPITLPLAVAWLASAALIAARLL
jgi:hypothetical protein